MLVSATLPRRAFLGLMAAGATAVCPLCVGGVHASGAPAEASPAAAGGLPAGPAHWGYGAQGGPEHWG